MMSNSDALYAVQDQMGNAAHASVDDVCNYANRICSQNERVVDQC
ncbi:hypothetical protein [Natrinema sp. CBA1119]|nr:hypothetical protein [Natrinema sp. CBA1119]